MLFGIPLCHFTNGHWQCVAILVIGTVLLSDNVVRDPENQEKWWAWQGGRPGVVFEPSRTLRKS